MKAKFVRFLFFVGIAITATIVVALIILTNGLFNKWGTADKYSIGFEIASILCFASAWGIFTGAKRRRAHEIPYKELTDNPSEHQKQKDLFSGAMIFAEKPKQNHIRQPSLKQVIEDIQQEYYASGVLAVTGFFLAVTALSIDLF
jgi:hypothetical protein